MRRSWRFRLFSQQSLKDGKHETDLLGLGISPLMAMSSSDGPPLAKRMSLDALVWTPVGFALDTIGHQRLDLSDDWCMGLTKYKTGDRCESKQVGIGIEGQHRNVQYCMS